MIFSIIYHNFGFDNCYLFYVKLINYEITNKFYQQVLPTSFKCQKINKLPIVIYLVFTALFVNAQVDCSAFGISVTVHPQNCSATFVPKVPPGITPDYYSWVLYNSYFDTCATSEDEIWNNYFCFDDTYEVELKVYFNGGADVCTIYKNVIITCTNNSCSKTNSNPFGSFEWTYLYLDPGCFGTNYKIFFRDQAEQNTNCSLFEITVSYLEPTNVLVTPCIDPGPIIPRVINVVPGEDVCIWARHGTKVVLTVHIPATCCNEELCFSDFFWSSPEIPTNPPHICPGFTCSSQMTDACENSIEWLPFAYSPCSSNMIDASDNSYAIDYHNQKISDFVVNKRIIQVNIIDIKGKMLYRGTNTETEDMTGMSDLKKRYEKHFNPGLNFVQLLYEDGSINTIKIVVDK